MKNLTDLSQFQELKNLEFVARHVVEGFITGLHKSPFHGFSVEFAEHRLYNTGESTKHIDWRLYARTERLYIKRYQEETNLRAHILIDTSSSMYFPYNQQILNKLNYAAVCAASLIYLLRKQRDAVGLTFFSDEVNFNSESKLSPVHAKLLFSKLDNLISQKPELNKITKVAKCLHQIADSIHKRSLVIIFSDMFDSGSEEDLFDALQHIKHNKHDVILFHVHDKLIEKDLKLENRPYKIIDMESGETISLNAMEFKDVFKQRSKEYYEKIKLKCAQYQIDFIEADIQGDFKQMLIPYLIKRSKLF